MVEIHNKGQISYDVSIVLNGGHVVVTSKLSDRLCSIPDVK